MIHGDELEMRQRGVRPGGASSRVMHRAAAGHEESKHLHDLRHHQQQRRQKEILLIKKVSGGV